MIGKLVLHRRATDVYGCIRVKLHFCPNGHIAERNDYMGGELYLRTNEYGNLLDAFKAQGLWEVAESYETN